MSFEINDVTSLMIQRSLAGATKELEASLVKVSYGKQMSAAEDAANMMISEQMESQRRGAQEAAENLQAGMNALAVAEGGLSTTNDNLQRIRELAIQRENGTYSADDKAAIDKEIGALMEEIDRVGQTTKFNNVNLLDGSASELSLQSGGNADPATNSLKVGDALKDPISSTDLNLDPSDPDFLNNVDQALTNVNSRRAEIGAYQARMEGTINSLYVQNENLTAAQSRISDVDVAAEASKITQNQILQNASASLLSQANQSASIAATLL